MIAGSIGYNKFKFLFERCYPIPISLSGNITAKLYMHKGAGVCTLVLVDTDAIPEFNKRNAIVPKRSREVRI